MGAVTRHLLEDEEERVTGDASHDKGSDLAPAASSSGSDGAAKTSARAAAGGGKGKTPARGTPGPVVRRGASSARRRPPPEDDVWAQSVDAADGAGRVVGPESRIQPRRSAARIEGVRPEAAERVGRSPSMRIASWGAVLAAVAVLVVMIAAGWLDVGPREPSGDGAGEPHKEAR
ncbi:hypothetical protein ABE85_07205 [Mitsuaria sp. 7]|nr:hypothetical protein ABE85_07205 [Mitsuaria sp. 7]